jgi:hypothetical protein
MTMIRWCCCVVLGLSVTASFAQAPTAISPDSTIDQLLDALDARGDTLNTLVADVAKSESDASLGEDPATADTRIGRVVYERKPDGDVRIRASFDKVRSGEKVRSDRVEYVLENGELIDRNYRGRAETRRVVRKPGEKLELFRLGRGPLPLPIGQAREDVLAEFEVTKVAAAEGDPADTVHLKLSPKPGTDLARDFLSIDVWVDLTDHLPRRMETLNVTGTQLVRTELSNVKINAPVKDSDFVLEKIDPDQWQINRGE